MNASMSEEVQGRDTVGRFDTKTQSAPELTLSVAPVDYWDRVRYMQDLTRTPAELLALVEAEDEDDFMSAACLNPNADAQVIEAASQHPSYLVRLHAARSGKADSATLTRLAVEAAQGIRRVQKLINLGVSPQQASHKFEMTRLREVSEAVNEATETLAQTERIADMAAARGVTQPRVAAEPAEDKLLSEHKKMFGQHASEWD
jgi:hypothetical protein